MKPLLRVLLTLSTISVLFGACSKKVEIPQKDLIKYVNPFIGTDGTGHTFPGPVMPFGMVAPGPDNANKGWDYTSGYQLRDSTILGFSQTRASGTGINEFGDILILPFAHEKRDFQAKKLDEKAELGYYSVLLDDSTLVELTTHKRTTFHRYTFTSDTAQVLLDFQHGLRFLTDSLVIDSDVYADYDGMTFTGMVHTKNWVERKYFFKLVFDHPNVSMLRYPLGPNERAPRFLLKFEDIPDSQLQVKIALSSVDVNGAKANMAAEIPDWDFEKIRAMNKDSWNNYLNRIQIEASSDQKEIFYTAMYHAFIHPSVLSDVDGRYRGADDKIYTTEGTYYSTLSLWDTYRAAHPLYTLITPEKVDDFVNTMLDHHDAQGFLPIWTAWGKENYCMIGNHSIPVITDAYLKGFDGFDANRALKAMVKSTSENHLNSNWDLYTKYGYYPIDSLDNEAVSRTLEHTFDDYAISIFAEELGEEEVAQKYFERSEYYRNLFDPETKLMRGKDAAGNFRTPFDPLTPTSPMNNPGDYTEANAWQYTWAAAQHAQEGMIELLGGREAFTQHLDTFFSIESEDNAHLGQEAMIGQYAHGNEPSHHIAYLYNWSNKPEEGRKRIHQIYNQFYDNTPQGITGNEDAGQMSAWYILTTLGFYPVNPAYAAFAVGEAQVSEAIVYLQNGKTINIKHERQAPADNLQVRWNGKEIDLKRLTYQQLINGGELLFK